MNFEDAEKHCMKNGGHLATVLNKEEWKLLKDQIGNVRGWLGGFQPEKDALWEWKSGLPFGFAKWNAYEPNNWGGKEDCVEVKGSGWNDRKCSDRNKAICEIRAALPNGMKPPAPQYVAHVAKKNHEEAQADCKSKGGNLATILSNV